MLRVGQCFVDVTNDRFIACARNDKFVASAIGKQCVVLLHTSRALFVQKMNSLSLMLQL